MRMEEIKIGDLFLGNIGGVVPGFAGTSRTVVVTKIRQYYVECMTVPYNYAQKTYRIDYHPLDLVYKFKSEAHMHRWMEKNPIVDLMFPVCDKSHKNTWEKKLVGDYFEPRRDGSDD